MDRASELRKSWWGFKMVSMVSKLKIIFYAPAIALFLLFSPLSSLAASAQSMSMDAEVSNCGPCSASSVVSLPEKQKQIIRENEQDPGPPPLPYYVQNFTFPEPTEPVASLIFGSLIRPPDLVKLYANLRF